MVYSYRGSYGRREYYGRKFASGKRLSAASAAYKALSISRRNAARLNVEHKICDFQFNAVSITSTPTVFYMTNLSTGTDNTQRIGHGVRLLSSYLSIFVYMIGSNAGTTAAVKLLVFRDKSSCGVTPGGSQVYESPSISIGAGLNTDYAGNRFEVISSKRVMLMNSYHNNEVVQLYKPLKEARVKYSGNSSSVSDLVSGGIFLFAQMITTGGGTPSVFLRGYHRSTFVDN